MATLTEDPSTEVQVRTRPGPRRPMTDEQLLAAITAEESSAIGSQEDGATSAARADAIARYLGEPYGNEQAGRSAVVSRDVSDVVDGVLANVLKPFVTGERMVEFEPQGEEDEQAAEQESDYINFIVMQRNSGFAVLHAGVKEALLLRNGYIGVDWTKRDNKRLERYEGLSDEEMQMLIADPAVEIVQHSEYAAPMPALDSGLGTPPESAAAPPPMKLHDVVLRKTHPVEYARIDPIPPDEMLVSERLRESGLQEADFCQRRVRRSISYLREQGYDIADDISDSDAGETLEEIARGRTGSTKNYDDDETADPARRLVLFKTSYLCIDRDGDGIAELRRVCSVGQNLLSDEEVDLVPIASGTGVLMPHQHQGQSVYDAIKDVAEIKTTLTRSFLDNKYLANNGRTAVDRTRVEIPDLMVSRPGGIVRTEGPPAESVMPMPFVDTGASCLQALEYIDTVRENRTGYTRQTQGLSTDSLSTETFGGQKLQLSQSQTRLEMTARTLAETLVRDLFRILHAVTLKHATKAEKVRLRGKWVVVDPRTWVNRYDLTIAVGLGLGTADQQLAKLGMFAPVLEKLGALGLVGPQEAYNYGAEFAKAMGYRSPARFIREPPVDPQTGQMLPPPQPPNPLAEAEKVKGEAQMQVAQVKAQADAQIAAAKAAAEADVEKQRLALQAALERERTKNELELDAMKHDRNNQTELEKARIQAATAIEVARINRGLDDGLAAAQATLGALTGDANSVAATVTGAAGAMQQVMENFARIMQQHTQAMEQHAIMANAPKEIVRDPMSGRAVGIRPTGKLQ